MGVLSRIASSPCQNSFEKVTIYGDSNGYLNVSFYRTSREFLTACISQLSAIPGAFLSCNRLLSHALNVTDNLHLITIQHSSWSLTCMISLHCGLGYDCGLIGSVLWMLWMLSRKYGYIILLCGGYRTMMDAVLLNQQCCVYNLS